MAVARFTLAYWCVLAAALLPIVCAGIAKWGMFGKPRRDGGFDNDNPRAWVGAVVIAHQLGAYQARLDLLAFVFVVLRLVFIMLYVANLANLRSLVWLLAFGVNVAILFAGYR